MRCVRLSLLSGVTYAVGSGVDVEVPRWMAPEQVVVDMDRGSVVIGLLGLRVVVVLLGWRVVVVLLGWRVVVVLLRRRVVVVLLRCGIIPGLGSLVAVVLRGWCWYVCSLSGSVVSFVFVVDARVFAVLAVVVAVGSLVRSDVICQRRGSDVDVVARGFEAAFGSSVLDLADLARVVDVAVLAEHLARGVLRFDLEASISSLVSVAVGSVFVGPVDLL